MCRIFRQPATAAEKSYDLIIIGGGIYGIMLSLEASRRGLRALLLERDDFGGATSFNSLRILHGGFRYLQTMDHRRFRESVAERRWFLKTFPGLVRPLPCIMPLYGNGLRRPFVLRIASWINDSLSYKRNDGVWPEMHLRPGRVIDAEQTRKIFPSVEIKGLQGAAVWYDACMPDSQRLLMEILRRSCEYGTTALNYIEARQLLKINKGVAGVIAIDRESGKSHEYKASVVVNATGPWCRNLAVCFDQDEPALFKSSLAWNVLLDKKALSNHALAVTPKKPGGRTYFIVPWKGILLAGTGHAAWLGSEEKPMPTNEQLQEFLNDLNLAVPGLAADQNEILHVFAGLLPATKLGGVALAVREVILNHANHGGPQGLYSISGVKFTTSRLVAEKVLKRIFPEKKVTKDTVDENYNPLQDEAVRRGIFSFDWYPSLTDRKWKEALQLLIQEESVQHLDDLIFRRTTLWENPKRALWIAPYVCELFEWDDSRCNEEMERLTRKLEQIGD
ncbi:MAG: FAD-dependent oxidoreductase [Proteobacteria bacterium]|nr:FAD-dependent oxidoreductase [Pseudomonadota bacterium]